MHNEVVSTSPRFSVEETGRVIERATELSHDHDLTYDQLVEVAAELGIKPEAVDEALATIRDESPEPRVITFDRCLEVLCLKPAR
jgi:cobalamin biosynthesis protein CbiG